MSSSSHFLSHGTQAAGQHLPVVEYVKLDGSRSRTKILKASKDCFHTGHVHVLGQEDSTSEEEGEGWVAVSSCSGLVSAV